MVKIVSFSRPHQRIVIENHHGTNLFPLTFKEWEHLSNAFNKMVKGEQ